MTAESLVNKDLPQKEESLGDIKYLRAQERHRKVLEMLAQELGQIDQNPVEINHQNGASFEE